VAIVGEVGSGKSSLLSALMGDLRLARGRRNEELEEEGENIIMIILY
jgi:ABC-type hemin transport system ATPase subunit